VYFLERLIGHEIWTPLLEEALFRIENLRHHHESSSMPNRFCACDAPALELGQSSRSLKTAPMPVAVLPMRVLPSVLKLPI
jgi:hypothetical protein